MAGLPETLKHELEALLHEMQVALTEPSLKLESIHPSYRESARNLICYLALRRHDLRSLQVRLSQLGLSSLGRAEAHVLASLQAVLDVLRALNGGPGAPLTVREDFTVGEQRLNEHALRLLGPPSPERSVRIMVTMPSEAAHDYTLVHDLLHQGMNCMRINCAHDDAAAWAAMIKHVRRAEQHLGRSCKVVMDLAGPKLRTGPLEGGPAVLKIRPRRDVYGQVLTPARVWFTQASDPKPAPTPADASLPVDSRWLARLNVGEMVKLVDARDCRRSLRVVDVGPDGCWAEARKTMYLVPSTRLVRSVSGQRSRTSIGPQENSLPLKAGDCLWLTRNQDPGRRAAYDSCGQLLTPARIGCTLPEALEHVQAGDSIWFDDGKLGGVVEQVETTHLVVRITRARARGLELRSDRGINLPDTEISLSALTEKDLQDLDFVAHHADVLELSFANRVADVEDLQRELDRLTNTPPAIVLKIETRQGFENLPAMLLAAMRGNCCGVMIARGDLAVECGFERMAEVQEEMLWICEAAHVPVIWSTQVLETLSKEGMPSRAEISDAAMGHRAECVNLNKGPHVLTAVRVLDDILRRMEAHQAKKRSMLRELHLAHTLDLEPTGLPAMICS